MRLVRKGDTVSVFYNEDEDDSPPLSVKPLKDYLFMTDMETVMWKMRSLLAKEMDGRTKVDIKQSGQTTKISVSLGLPVKYIYLDLVDPAAESDTVDDEE